MFCRKRATVNLAALDVDANRITQLIRGNSMSADENISEFVGLYFLWCSDLKCYTAAFTLTVPKRFGLRGGCGPPVHSYRGSLRFTTELVMMYANNWNIYDSYSHRTNSRIRLSPFLVYENRCKSWETTTTATAVRESGGSIRVLDTSLSGGKWSPKCPRASGTFASVSHREATGNSVLL